MVEVYFTKRGAKRLEDLGAEVQKRVKDKLRDARDRPGHFLKPLRSRDDFVLRVGDYRALVEWDRTEGVLYVKSVGHRRNFYDREA